MKPLEPGERPGQRLQEVPVGPDLLQTPEAANRLRKLRQAIVADVQISQANHPREQRLAKGRQLVVVQIQVVGQTCQLGERLGQIRQQIVTEVEGAKAGEGANPIGPGFGLKSFFRRWREP